MKTLQEVRAAMNVTSARYLMRELQAMLNRLSKSSETNAVCTKQEKTPMECHEATVHEQTQVETQRALDFGEKMAQIETVSKDLIAWLDEGDINCVIISTLVKINEVLPKLPTSHRAEMQARFSDLCSQAYPMMDNILDRMKIQFDAYFNHELATATQSSS